MAVVRPFRAVRPLPSLAEQIASLPYDVMDRAEAKAMAGNNELSFLHVVRAEIDLPDSVDDYADQVYEKGCQRLRRMMADGVLVQDQQPFFYIYRQIMKGRVQTGLVATFSVDEYLSNKIKKHEFTRKEKEVDRTRHFDTCDAHTEPVFLTYRWQEAIDRLIADFIKFTEPVYDFKTEDQITHIFWVLDDPETISQLESLFAGIPSLYIADGHHRSAVSANVALKRREEYPDAPADAEFNYFMAVVFPDQDLFIMDYNRLVKDLNGMTPAEFLERIGGIYQVERVNQAFHPHRKAEMCMYLDGSWYKLTAPPSLFEGLDPVRRLDVSILQDNVLTPLLDIDDPRTSMRIDFVGGIRGLDELKRRVDAGWAAAFAMCPTTMDDLLAIADAEMVMPPKSTWFEPKLRSGLFVHLLSN
ncbi:MAG TPA: DUF1015 family protein [Bacillota bacterium]|mgnify:CR=1 FL=1|jgi:uncharacterized protein (DUF1015 family)|nr:DUF1015 domain-containing protein [Fastidiosipila sp.]HPX93606.1 DUF1015 family protein [Bacillota bacterium]HQB81534.1 DUF1015 family protein [Bacillota bacterium]